MTLKETTPRILRVNIANTLEYGDRIEILHNNEVISAFICDTDDSRAELRLKLKPIEPLTYNKIDNNL